MNRKRITATIDCHGKKFTGTTKAFFIQGGKIISKARLHNKKIIERDILVDCDEKLYVCIGDNGADIEAETEEEAWDCDDTLLARIIDRSAFGNVLLLQYVLDPDTISCIKDMYQYCVIHEINIEKYNDFKLLFHGDEGIGVYYFTSQYDDLIKLHFWDTDVKRDFKHYTFAYIQQLAQLLLIVGITVFCAVTFDVKIILALAVIPAILAVLSLIHVPRRIIKEYRYVKKALDNELYRDSRMEDILHIALWGEDKKFISLGATKS